MIKSNKRQLGKRVLGGLGLFLFLISCFEAEDKKTDHAGLLSDHELSELPQSQASRFLVGNYAKAHGDWDLAADLYDRLVKFDDQNNLLRQHYLFISLYKKDYQKAQAIVEDLYDRNVIFDVSVIIKFVEEFQKKDFVKAEQVLKDAESLDQMDSAQYQMFKQLLAPILRAWMFVDQQKFNEALVEIDKLGTRSELNSVYALQKAFIYERMGDLVKAQQFFELAVATLPVGHHFYLASQFYLRHDMQDEAERIFQKYNHLRPDNWLEKDLQGRLKGNEANVKEGKENIAPKVSDSSVLPVPITPTKDAIAEAMYEIASQIYYKNGKDAAIYYSFIVFMLNPNHEPSNYLLGSIMADSGYYPQAEKYFLTIEKDGFYKYRSMLRLSEVYMFDGQYDRAKHILDQLNSLRPNNAFLMIAYAKLFQNWGKYEESLDYFSKAIEANSGPHKWSLFFDRGLIYQELGKWQLAETDFLAALDMNADDPILLNHIGYSWLEKGVNFPNARKLLERAYELDPRNPAIIDSLGLALYLSNDYANAVRLFEEALMQLPNDDKIMDHLGDGYWKLGRETEAKIQWNRALQLGSVPEENAKIQQKLSAGL